MYFYYIHLMLQLPFKLRFYKTHQSIYHSILTVYDVGQIGSISISCNIKMLQKLYLINMIYNTKRDHYAL